MSGWIPDRRMHRDLVLFGSRIGWLRPVIACCGVLASLCAGCEPGPDRAPASRRVSQDRSRSAKILVIGNGQDAPEWDVLRKTCERFAVDQDRLVIKVESPKIASPREQQDMLAEAQVSRDGQPTADVVCILPIDSSAVRQSIENVSLGGIPVVTIGRDVPDSERRMYCGPSAHEIGVAAAHACGSAIEGRSPRIMLLHAGDVDSEYSVRRYSFLAELPAVPGPELMREVDCGANRADALRLVKYEVKRYPRVGAWVFLEDWPFHVLSPGDELLPLGCALVLCNGSPEYFDRVRDGRVHALIAYDAQRAVEEALHVARQLAERKVETFRTSLRIIPSEIITSQELPAYEARWAAWRQGLPSPKNESEPQSE